MKREVDARLSSHLRTTLWSGLAASLACIVAGVIWTALAGGRQGVMPLGDVFPSLRTGRPEALVALGILLLLLTPLATVVVALTEFLRARERLWAGIALIVLAVL
ncbi:MAG: DUF1634 domain-containing protein, partial [Dehalococcoidia bacterium]|nr:DUF1634 domain-containing protein [Dehalococcoidia bacterium]